jgi:hypothetical protein
MDRVAAEFSDNADGLLGDALEDRHAFDSHVVTRNTQRPLF